MSIFLQWLSEAGQAIVSGAEWVGSALETGFSDLVNDFGNFFGGVGQALQSLPSDISNFFQSLAGAIVTFAKLLGTYIWDGLQAIGSGLSKMMAPIAKALTYLEIAWMDLQLALQYDLKSFASDIVNFFTSTIGNTISGVISFFNDVKTIFVNAYNFILNISSDVYYVVNTIVNFFFNMPVFFDNISNYLNKLFTDPGNQPNLLTMIPNIITSEATRVAGAFPAVIRFNTFMELFPKIVNSIANYPVYTGGLRSIFGKALLLVASPVITALMSLATEMVMQYIFNSAQTTQTVPRPSQPQIQPLSNAPSVQLPPRTVSTGSVSDLQPPQFSTFTPKKIEAQLEKPTTTGVFIEDVIGMGTPDGGTIELVSGYVIFQSVSQESQDTFEVIPIFAMQSMTPPYYILSQGMGTNMSVTLTQSSPQPQNGTQKYILSQGMGVSISPALSQTDPGTQKYILSQGMGVSISPTLSQTDPGTQKYILSQGMGTNMSITMSGGSSGGSLSSPPPSQSPSQKYILSQGMGVTMSVTLT